MFGVHSLALVALATLTIVSGRPLEPFSEHRRPAWASEIAASHSSVPTGTRTSSFASTGSSPARTGYFAPSGTAPSSTRFNTTVSPPSFAAATSNSSVWASTGSTFPTPSSSTFALSTFSSSASDSSVSTTSVWTSSTFTTSWASTASSSSTNAAYPTNSASLPDVIRGVNIGGWLILEKWMTPDVFTGTSAIDQYTFDSTNGAAAKLQSHWSSYFTEADVQKIASWGINALRIPIGYWAYDNGGTPYITGADVYLEQAIGWARNAGLKVLVDCHGSPGSQNGFDNSGQSGPVEWQHDDNLKKSISVLETMAKKYGSAEYADVVFAIELANEPISWGANLLSTTQSWSQQAYAAVKAAAANKDLIVIMHDSFVGPSQWTSVGSLLNGDSPKSGSKFAMDVHLYQNQEAVDSFLTQDQHIAKACSWTTTKLLPSSAQLPVYVGEFSAATNICANPDGSTVPGSVCWTEGCQCSANVPIEQWNQPLIQATRKFLEAEMDAFEHGAAGWFMWSYHGFGAWGLDQAVKYGIVGSKVTDRKYPNQCNLW